MSGQTRFLFTKDGVRLAYATHGSGPPLVFVRGWISHLDLLWDDECFRSFMETLGEQYLVVRYDMRGNGLSQRRVGRIDLETLVLDLEAIVEQLELRRPVLYGASFGGPIAIRYAAKHPQRVEKLVLDGTFARGRLITNRARKIMLTKTLRFFPEMAFLLLAYVTNPERRNVGYRRPEIARQMISPALAAKLYTLAFETDVSEHARRLETPTLVLHSRESQAIPFHLGAELASLIPASRLIALPGPAHNAWEGDRAHLLQELSLFLGARLSRAFALVDVETPGGPLRRTTLSRYRLGERIGTGGMGVVHRARDLKLRRDVAVKLLAPAGVRDPAAIRRFRREIGLSAALRHPNVCSILDVGETEDGPFLVMELLEGETLADVMGRTSLHVVTALEIMRQMITALEAAHAQGVVHRDVKPANVFLTVHGQVKVLDFGLAKALGPGRSEASDSLSQSGVIVGTLAYMSPEQAQGGSVDGRSDLFSVGVVLHEMVTGESPFRRDSTPSTLEAIQHHDPIPRLSSRGDLPSSLVRLLTDLLEKRPESRVASASDVLDRLGNLRREIGASTTEAWPVPRAASRSV